MSRNRQSIAWFVLLSSFITCLLLTIAVPVGITTYRQRAIRLLAVDIHPNQGTIALEQPSGQELLTEIKPNIAQPATILTTSPTDTGLIELFEPEQRRLVGRIQLLGNVDVTVVKATTPRFASSSAERHLNLDMARGRLRVVVPAEADRSLRIVIETPHGELVMDQPGRYLVEVDSAETQLSVTEGEAALSTPGGSGTLLLTANQRGRLTADVAEGPYGTDRNLITNGDFADGMGGWIELPWNKELDEEPNGTTEIVRINDEPAIRFARNGLGHVDTSVRQLLNKELAGYDNLQLLVTVRFLQQSLPVCGSLGTECPLTVRIDYVSASGQEEAWQQGLYAVGEPSAEAPDFCAVCGPPLNLYQHSKVRFGQVVFFESGDLLERMELEGIRPIRLNSISLVAAGHTFEYDILEVALVAAVADDTP